jgi:hypothetical protein
MIALRKSLAYLSLVCIPTGLYALAWYSTPASEWNLVRGILFLTGKLVLAASFAVLTWVTFVWAWREVTNAHGQGGDS